MPEFEISKYVVQILLVIPAILFVSLWLSSIFKKSKIVTGLFVILLVLFTVISPSIVTKIYIAQETPLSFELAYIITYTSLVFLIIQLSEKSCKLLLILKSQLVRFNRISNKLNNFIINWTLSHPQIISLVLIAILYKITFDIYNLNTCLNTIDNIKTGQPSLLELYNNAFTVFILMSTILMYLVDILVERLNLFSDNKCNEQED